ncbi:MAG: hypothetical protein GY797_40735 [Deltaproteobacteria bacterium]|nr:hypothetical protein [Deltaproteobacteria bacterium]
MPRIGLGTGPRIALNADEGLELGTLPPTGPQETRRRQVEGRLGAGKTGHLFK